MAFALLAGFALSITGMRAAAVPADGYGVEFWGDAEGLPQSRIRAIEQTRDGYVWLGTDGGLVRFDGASFQTFSADTGDLKDNEVWALREDREGSLWIGTYGGGISVLRNGTFRTFTRADGLPDEVVMAIDKDREGAMWMITPQGVARYFKGAFRKFGADSGLGETRVLGICGNSPQGVLAATRNNVYRFANGKFEALNAARARQLGAVEHLLCSRSGAVWLGYGSGAISQWTGEALTTYNPPSDRGRQINRLYEDPNGGVWAAIGQQLTKLEGGRFTPVTLAPGASPPGSIYSIWMEREGSVWLGLQSNGLAHLRPRQLSTLTVDNGLPDNRARAVFQDGKGDWWIGTADGLARRSGDQVTVWTEFEGTRLGDVRSIAEDTGGGLWISAGKDVLLMRNGHLSRLPNWTGKFEIEAVYRDTKGDMWIATDGEGAYRWSHGTLTHFGTANGLGSNHLRAMLNDRNGTLWFSTFGSGVTKYAGGVFTVISTKDGLAGDRVAAMHQDEEGALWFATRRGLSRLKDGRFFTWTAGSGLVSSFVYTIVDDGNGYFWFSSAQGIFRVSKADLRAYAAGKLKSVHSVAYGVKDGMATRAGNLGNQPAAWKTTGGALLFSSMKGVVIVDPARMPHSTLVGPVRIERIVIDKTEQPIDQTRQAGGRGIEAPRGAGGVELHYAALSYFTPEKLRFRYRLEGIDRDWVDAGGRRFTYYANLPPGRYVFRVMAGNTDGPWSGSEASLAFYLTPPFYRTPTFLALTGLLALLGAWLVYRFRMHGLRMRYRAVLAERNRISRDLHDTLAQNLAGIALQLDAVQMEVPEVGSKLGKRLDEACNLTRYSLAEARRAITDLREDDLEQQGLFETLPEIVQRAAAAGAFESRFQLSASPRRLNPVTEKNLLRISQEALANTVKHSRARNVDVQLQYAPDKLSLRVYDDGCGFDTRKNMPLMDGHFGLLGMRERAERIGGHLTLTSKPGSGTELCLAVPIQEKS